MKLVLFIVSTLRKSGPTHQLLHLTRHLPELGFSTRILTLSPERPNDTMKPQFEAIGVEVSSLELTRLEGLFVSGRRARAVVQEIKPSLIHSQGLRSDQVASRIHGLVPHVLTVRNSAWDDYPAMFGRLKGSVMAWQHTRIIRAAQKPIACSESLAHQLRTYRPDLRAIQNGVDTTSYTPIARSEQPMLRQQLGLSESRPILLHVGSLIERKRPEDLLRVVLSAGVLDHLDLVFVGDGPLRPALENQARAHPNIRFVGAVRNVSDYLRCATMLISLSRSEGLPNSVLEALSCGLPVALSAIDAHVEIAAHENGAGVLIKDTSAEAVSTAIQELLSQDSARLAERARDLALRAFSSRAMAHRYAQTYSALLGITPPAL